MRLSPIALERQGILPRPMLHRSHCPKAGPLLLALCLPRLGRPTPDTDHRSENACHYSRTNFATTFFVCFMQQGTQRPAWF